MLNLTSGTLNGTQFLKQTKKTLICLSKNLFQDLIVSYNNMNLLNRDIKTLEKP